MAAPLEHYGLIGDSTTVALVSRNGSIDWLCLPRVDSGACFARLLGTDRHGYWTIRPAVEVLDVLQRYRSETLVLETELICRTGRARLIDFMPPRRKTRHLLIRILEGLEGEVPVQADLKVRFDYGRLTPWIKCLNQRAFLISGPDALEYRCPVAVEHDSEAARLESSFVVRPGEKLPFTLEYYPSHVPFPAEAIDAERELLETESFWREWAGKCRYRGPYREAVVRSLITLKALTHEPTGGIVASATTSLPEELGGTRNWDYRYCWVRDSSLVLDALILGGYFDEAFAWRDWLMRVGAGAPAEAQIMYGVAGEPRLTEVELPWLPGYEESRPVRIGNAAHCQFQLDIYGETLATMYAARRFGAARDVPIAWDLLAELVSFVEQNWQRPDEGMWEVRSGRKSHFTHSKLMAWVALDRGVRFLEHWGKDAPPQVAKRLLRWRAVREEIRADILTRGFNRQVGAFAQSYNSSALDASLLVIPHVGFLPATDPRMLATVSAIEKGLCWDGFVQRYSTDTNVDGLASREAAFVICTFWLVDNYAMSGRLDEAEALFERLLALQSDVGLLAEEYHPQLQRQLGNFPQAFSHVGLIYSAFAIEAKRADSSKTSPPVSPQ
jgi:GH15 family glucan-1,4-alpha-glucosidase